MRSGSLQVLKGREIAEPQDVEPPGGDFSSYGMDRNKRHAEPSHRGG